MKILKSFIVLVLCFAFLPAAPFQPQAKAAETEEEFIKNGSFETLLQSGAPESWNVGNGAFEKNFFVSDTSPQKGERCVGVTSNPGVGYVYIYQGIEGICSEKTYKFSASFLANSSVEVMMKLEFRTINSEGNSESRGEVFDRFRVLNGNHWQTKEMTVTAPEGAYSATVMLRLQESGAEKTVFIDDVSFFGEKRTDFIPEIDPASLPVYTVKPMAEGAVELLTNGDLASREGWTPMENDWTKNVLYTDKYYRGDTGHSISITMDKNTSKTPFVYKTVPNITPLAEHQVSVYLRTHALSSSGFGFKFEYLDANNTCIKEELSARYHYITGANWAQFAYYFLPPENTAKVRILFRLFGTGTIYFDDASCYRTEEPRGIFLSTDAVYYYLDNEEIHIKTEMNTVSYPSLSKEDISVRLTKDGETVGDIIKLKPSEGYTECTMPLSLLTTEKAEYQIEASAGGHTERTSVYLYPRPKRLTKDGIYMLDGKPFHPVFAYHVDPQYYEDVKEAGINVVQCTVEDLEACHKAGLKALVILYRNMYPAGHPKNETFTKNFVETHKEHPAVFAWAIMDEPFSHDPGAEQYLKNAYKIIRDIDDVHPVFVMEVGEKKHIAIKYADIFGIDPYVSQNDPATYVAMKTAESHAVSMGKPIYNLLQAFSYNGYFPTEDAMRNMLYQALWEKSKAVGYYEFDESLPAKPLKNTELWPVLCNWYQNEAKILFGHFAENPDTKIEEYQDSYVLWRTFTYAGKLYVAVRNLSSKGEAQAEISLPDGFTLEKAEILGGIEESAISECSNNRLRLKLGATEAALLELLDSEADAVYSFTDTPIALEGKAEKIKIFFGGSDADVYMGVYSENAGVKELLDMAVLRDADKIGMLSVLTGGKYTIKTFAFSAGTLRPKE